MELRGTYKGGGGPDKTILLSAAKHNKRKFFVPVIYLRRHDDLEFRIGEMAAKLHIKYKEVIDRKLIDVRCLCQLNRLTKTHNIEIVHTHDDKSLLYAFLLKLLNSGLKVIHTCHLYPGNSSTVLAAHQARVVTWFRQRVSLFLMKQCYQPILSVCRSTKQTLVAKGFKECEVEVIFNSIDYSYWRKDPVASTLHKEIQADEGTFIVGSVGRLSEAKDLPTFVRVVKKVIEKCPNTKFVVAGDGRANELRELRDLCVRVGIESEVVLLGHRTDLINIYSAFDLFLMTSIAEGLPNTLLEAMSMEIPVVSTAVDGVPELVVNGETGYLCRVGDSEALAMRTVEIIQNPELRRKFGSAARDRIKRNFAFDKRLEKIEEFYQRIHLD